MRTNVIKSAKDHGKTCGKKKTDGKEKKSEVVKKIMDKFKEKIQTNSEIANMDYNHLKSHIDNQLLLYTIDKSKSDQDTSIENKLKEGLMAFCTKIRE